MSLGSSNVAYYEAMDFTDHFVKKITQIGAAVPKIQPRKGFRKLAFQRNLGSAKQWKMNEAKQGQWRYISGKKWPRIGVRCQHR